MLFQETQGYWHLGSVRTSVASDVTSRVSLKAQLYHSRGKIPSSWRTSKEQLWISKQVLVEQIIPAVGRDTSPEPICRRVGQTGRTALQETHPGQCCKAPPALGRSWVHKFPWSPSLSWDPTQSRENYQVPLISVLFRQSSELKWAGTVSCDEKQNVSLQSPAHPNFSSCYACLPVRRHPRLRMLLWCTQQQSQGHNSTSAPMRLQRAAAHHLTLCLE